MAYTIHRDVCQLEHSSSRRRVVCTPPLVPATQAEAVIPLPGSGWVHVHGHTHTLHAVWCVVLWCGVLWCGVVWYGVVGCGGVGVALRGVVAWWRDVGVRGAALCVVAKGKLLTKPIETLSPRLVARGVFHFPQQPTWREPHPQSPPGWGEQNNKLRGRVGVGLGVGVNGTSLD